MMSRSGVLGGMFDPVHTGHVAAARFALGHLQLDQVRLIPCHHPNHRAAAVASPRQRLAMLELACAGHPRLQVDAIEIERGGTSRSVDTLAALGRDAAAERSGSVVFILGVDAFNTLTEWHDWRKLPELCHLLVLARGDESVSATVADAIDLARRQATTPDALFASARGRICIARGFRHQVSSTAVRRKLRAGDDVCGLVAPDVLAFIRQHGLYG